jgi:hypothetical protein
MCSLDKCHLFLISLKNFGMYTPNLRVENKLNIHVYNNGMNSLGLTSAINVGPSGVCALPLTAGRNVGGHYKWHFFLLFLSFFLSSGSLLILPEGVVVGFRNFA